MAIDDGEMNSEACQRGYVAASWDVGGARAEPSIPDTIQTRATPTDRYQGPKLTTLGTKVDRARDEEASEVTFD